MKSFKELTERVQPSPETRAKLLKPLNKAMAAKLKLSLKVSVDGLDALAWELENRVNGVDSNAIKQLKGLYKDARKIEKSLKSAIDKAKE